MFVTICNFFTIRVLLLKVKVEVVLFLKKSPLGRGNAKGARRGDKNCAGFVIT